VQGESGLSKSWILPNTEGTESETTGWLVASACPVLHLPAHLALGRTMDRPLDEGVRPHHRTTDRGLIIDHLAAHGTDRKPTRGKAGQTSRPTLPAHRNTQDHRNSDRRTRRLHGSRLSQTRRHSEGRLRVVLRTYSPEGPTCLVI